MFHFLQVNQNHVPSWKMFTLAIYLQSLHFYLQSKSSALKYIEVILLHQF